MRHSILGYKGTVVSVEIAPFISRVGLPWKSNLNLEVSGYLETLVLYLQAHKAVTLMIYAVWTFSLTDYTFLFVIGKGKLKETYHETK